jgi:hypothetical protein
MLLQTRSKSLLDPLLESPVSAPLILENVALASGVTVINHKLGRKLQGWILTDTNGAATVYRSAPKDAKTLTLTSTAAITCNILVF